MLLFLARRFVGLITVLFAISVLVFVNRPTTNKQVKDPVVYKDQVTVTMQKVGDSWLVDNLVTSPAAG